MIPLLHGAGIVLLKHLSVSVNSIGHMWLQNIVYYCPHHYASTANHINFMYADRNETLISKPGYADFSLTSLQKKTWLIAESNLAPVPQSPNHQCMTTTNTCTSVYLAQYWSNIRSSSSTAASGWTVSVNLRFQPAIPIFSYSSDAWLSLLGLDLIQFDLISAKGRQLCSGKC